MLSALAAVTLYLASQRFAADCNTSEIVEEVVIIGSGPAGWTAAIYNARAVSIRL